MNNKYKEENVKKNIVRNVINVSFYFVYWIFEEVILNIKAIVRIISFLKTYFYLMF